MKLIKKNLGIWLITALVLMIPIFSFAQGQVVDDEDEISGTPCSISGKICNPLGDSTKTIPDFIHTVLVGALKIGIPLIALAIIYSGFLFVKARGNAEELTKAKDALMYTLIGAAILLGAWAIAELIANTILGLQ